MTRLYLRAVVRLLVAALVGAFALVVIPWAVESRWPAILLALALTIWWLRLTRRDLDRYTPSTTREK